ncbi:cysteine hydrolase family protein [Pseudomonas syringae]|uniref:cysteine hydrolase family protein n=1 Tax=Pseudomonas syringae TaxID=317 RepID=UPI003F770ABA
MFSSTLIASTQPTTPITRQLGKHLKMLMAGLGLLSVSLAAAASGESNMHPTLRALSGAMPVDHLQAASTALVVIDFQNEYFTGKLPIPDGMQALNNARRLINFADQSGIQVFHVQHIAPKDSPIFADGSQEVQFHPLMQPRAQDLRVRKSTVSVFASTDLDSQLKARGIKTVILAGLMTHACVAGAARDAAPLGYSVVVAADASATRAVTRFDGESVTSQQLHQAALTEIEDTFGDVLSTDRITALSVR